MEDPGQLFILCKLCAFGVRVVGDNQSIQDLLGAKSPCEGKYNCPSCGSACMSSPYVDNAVLREKDVRDLEPLEAYLLFEGMGYPEERDCVAEVVKDELLTKRIVKVVSVTAHGTTRAIIDHLVLEDGTTLFFSGSAHGAIIYRIRRPKAYSGSAS